MDTLPQAGAYNQLCSQSGGGMLALAALAYSPGSEWLPLILLVPLYLLPTIVAINRKFRTSAR